MNMDYKIRISPIAKANIKEAVSYYKKEASLKVAENFVKDYELALQKVKQNPFFQIYYKNFRGLPLKKFPYIIFFQVDEIRKLISINAVFQGNQNIDKRPYKTAKDISSAVFFIFKRTSFYKFSKIKSVIFWYNCGLVIPP